MLLFNFNSFDNNKPREGSEKDVQALKRIFETFGFSITLGLNLTKEGVEKKITQFKSEVLGGEKTCDMIVIVIMSHGARGGFYTSDDSIITMNYIMKYVYCIKLNMLFFQMLFNY